MKNNNKAILKKKLSIDNQSNIINNNHNQNHKRKQSVKIIGHITLKEETKNKINNQERESSKKVQKIKRNNLP